MTDIVNTQTANENVSLPTNSNSENPTENNVPVPEPVNLEAVKLKAALDKANKEAAEYKKQLRARQTAEETKSQEEAEQKAAIENELLELRKRFAVADHAKRIIPFIEDESMSSAIADSLYGAADADAVIDILSKAWSAKEKKLRLEFGRIPSPSSGDSSLSITKEQFESMSYQQRNELQMKNPELYNKLKL